MYVPEDMTSFYVGLGGGVLLFIAGSCLLRCCFCVKR